MTIMRNIFARKKISKPAKTLAEQPSSNTQVLGVVHREEVARPATERSPEEDLNRIQDRFTYTADDPFALFASEKPNRPKSPGVESDSGSHAGGGGGGSANPPPLGTSASQAAGMSFDPDYARGPQPGVPPAQSPGTAANAPATQNSAAN